MTQPDFYYETHHCVENVSYEDEFFTFSQVPYLAPLNQKHSTETEFTVNGDCMPITEGGVNDDSNCYFINKSNTTDGNPNDGYTEIIQLPTTEYFDYLGDGSNNVLSTQMYIESVLIDPQNVKPVTIVPHYDAGVANHPVEVDDNRMYKPTPTNEYNSQAIHQPSPPSTNREVIEPPPVLEFHGFAPPSNTDPNEVEELAIVQKKVLEKYISEFRKTVDNNSFRSRTRYYDIFSVDDLYTRLKKLKCCNLADRRCTYHTCGRQFVNLEVLAFHVGYAHQAKNTSSTCVVCGMTCRNSKGKLTHMVTAHKNLARKHQHICMVQAPKYLLAYSSSLNSS